MNLPPGMKHVTATFPGGVTIGPVPVLVEADSYNVVFMIPGYADKGPGF